MSDLDTDNLMPGGGAPWLPTEDQEQKNELLTEKANVFNALPLIQEIIGRFEEKIKFYESVKSIPNELKANPEAFMHMAVANEQTVVSLVGEKNYLEGLLDEYLI